MKRQFFLAVGIALAMAVSCSRDELREPRYDPHECPFCLAQKGECTYCNGAKRCTFCDGKGKRSTVVPHLPEKELRQLSYKEECPFCGGTGSCRYCGGTGVCRVCDGGGRVDSWDFHAKPRARAAANGDGKSSDDTR